MEYKLENGVTLELTEASRPPITFWMQAKIMPAHLTSQYVKMRNLIKPGENVDDLSDEEINQRIAATSVQRELTDDELLAQLDFQFKCVAHVVGKACEVQSLTETEFKTLYQFALFGERAIIAAVGQQEEGSASALETFRQTGQ